MHFKQTCLFQGRFLQNEVISNTTKNYSKYDFPGDTFGFGSHANDFQVDPEGNYIYIAIALIAVTIGMKFGGNMLGNFIFRQKRGKSLRSAFALAAPRGEFSIVIIKTGVDIGAVSAFLFPLIGVISIITAFLSPFLVKASDRIVPALKEKDV